MGFYNRVGSSFLLRYAQSTYITQIRFVFKRLKSRLSERRLRTLSAFRTRGTVLQLVSWHLLDKEPCFALLTIANYYA